MSSFAIPLSRKPDRDRTLWIRDLVLGQTRRTSSTRSKRYRISEWRRRRPRSSTTYRRSTTSFLRSTCHRLDKLRISSFHTLGVSRSHSPKPTPLYPPLDPLSPLSPLALRSLPHPSQPSLSRRTRRLDPLHARREMSEPESTRPQFRPIGRQLRRWKSLGEL